jgi:hypothetical protein
MKSSLADSAKLINRVQQLIRMRRNDNLMENLGHLLIFTQAKMKPEQWQAWLHDNCPNLDKRTAEALMQFATKRLTSKAG